LHLRNFRTYITENNVNIFFPWAFRDQDLEDKLEWIALNHVVQAPVRGPYMGNCVSTCPVASQALAATEEDDGIPFETHGCCQS